MPLIFDYLFVARPGELNNYSNKYPALIDTGAVFTIVSHAVAEKERLPKIKRHIAKRWGGGSGSPGWMRRVDVELEGAGRQLRLDVFVPDGKGSTVVGMDYMKLIESELRIGNKFYRITPIWPNPLFETPDIVTIFPPDVYDYVEKITFGKPSRARK